MYLSFAPALASTGRAVQSATSSHELARSPAQLRWHLHGRSGLLHKLAWVLGLQPARAHSEPMWFSVCTKIASTAVARFYWVLVWRSSMSSLGARTSTTHLGSKDDQERSKRPSKHLEYVASRPAERQLVVRNSPKSVIGLSLLHADTLLSIVRQSMSFLNNMRKTSRRVSRVDSAVDASPLLAQVPQCFATSATYKSIWQKTTFHKVNTKVIFTI